MEKMASNTRESDPCRVETLPPLLAVSCVQGQLLRRPGLEFTCSYFKNLA